MKGLFISGGSTEVGKTFIARHIIKALSTKFRVVARKPVESGCQQTPTGLFPKDATLLNVACTTPESIDTVCRFRFTACASAEKASAEQGVRLTLDDLKQASQPSNENDFVVVEGAGGWYSPIATQTLNSDLAVALDIPIVLVVKDGLGAINQALLSLHATKESGLTVVMLVLNQMTENNLNNAEALKAYTDVKVVVFSPARKDAFFKTVLGLVGYTV